MAGISPSKTVIVERRQLKSNMTSIVSVPEVKSFEERIKEVRIGSCRLLMLKSEVENVVSWQGSFLTYPDFAAEEELVQSLVVSLLDKGTLERDKFQLADVLENKGAEVRFMQRGLRIGFSGRSLSDDFDEVFDILVEQLLTPKFDPEEFDKSRMRIAASIQRSKDQTAARASLALRQLMYGPAHPNYSFTADEELATLQSLSASDVKAYHAAHFGANDCIMVVVGDIDMDAVEQTVARHFSKWAQHEVQPAFSTAYQEASPQVVHVPMPDKFNLDVRLGHQLDIRRQDKQFTPLHVGNFILGGNFSSRLMDVIRDEMGLTYGVHASLPGVSKHYGGHWQISITLSQDKLEEGIDATKKLVTDFVQKGVSEEELEEKKTTITGSYKVQMGTTHGLASLILRSLERGFERSRLDTFSGEVAALTTDDVNSALTAYLNPESLHVASAGTKAD